MKSTLRSLWITALLMLTSQSLFAYYDYCIGGIYYKITATSRTKLTVSVTDGNTKYDNDYNSYHGDISIPSTIRYGDETYSVTSISSLAFYKCTELTSVTLPNSVTSIESQAFADCPGLTSVIISNNLTSIDKNAFDGCTSLQYNEYKDGLYLGDNENPYIALIKAKSRCVIVNSNCKTIAERAFSGSTEMSITIPNGVTTIDKYAFYGCSIWKIIIPNSVTTIGEYAFAGCHFLKSISIPNNVISIDKNAFDECNQLKYNWDNGRLLYLGNDENPFVALIKTRSNSYETYEINPRCKYIASSAFSDCTELYSISIPDSVTSIGNKAFYGTKLYDLIIPNSVTSIGEYAFYGCSMPRIDIPNSVTHIGIGAFQNCRNLKKINISNSLTCIEAYTFSGCCSVPIRITIPNSVTTIEPRAFYGTAVGQLFIGSNVNFIDLEAFKGCTSLNEIFSNALVPPLVYYYDTFEKNLPFDGTLYVPAASLNDYKTAPFWKTFIKIKVNPYYSGIECLTSDGNDTAPMHNLQGQKVTSPIRGDIIFQSGKKFLTK